MLGNFLIASLGLGGSEISAYAAKSKLLAVVDGGSTLKFVNLANPSAPDELTDLAVDLGSEAQSVAVYGNLVAVAVSATNRTDAGTVMFFRIVNDRMGYRVLPVGVVTVGSLPDSIAFNSDGSKLLVANEGEPSDDYSFDPEGSLSVIDVDYDPTTKDYSFTNTSITFSGLTETDLPEGVRISGPEGTTVAQDLEPEFVSIIGNTAYVSLQENNAIAIVDLTDNSYKILSAGSVDFSSLPVDFDDEDGGFKPVFASVTGLNMPDGLAAFSSAERTYFISANEGDAREYGDYADDERAEDLSIEIPQNSRLKLLIDQTTPGNPVALGSRSITIFDADGNPIWNSGNQLQDLAVQAGVYDDSRSDDKGVEPEGVTVGIVGGRTFAFVGLERTTSSMVAIYDVTDPAQAFNVGYRVMSDSISPEGLAFIPAGRSPNREPLLVVSNEVSGTIDILDLMPNAGDYTQSMLKDVGGDATELSVTPLLTIGEAVGKQDFIPTGIPDGMGAYENHDGTYTLLINSELSSSLGYPYQLANGTELTGARVTSLVIDKDTDDDASNGFQSAVLRGGLAYRRIIGRDGRLVDSAADLAGGLNRLCSANLIEANRYGKGKGFENRTYLLGEETDNGTFYALDVDRQTLWAAPSLGRGSWESATLLDTGRKDKVAVLLADDKTDAPLYLWVGNKKSCGNFLDRNGLQDGTLYAWSACNPMLRDPSDFNGSRLIQSMPQAAGHWVALGQGQEIATLTDVQLRERAFRRGAFHFSRPEDLDVNPLNGRQAVIASTGSDSIFDGADTYGDTYVLNVRFNGKGNPSRSNLRLVYDGDAQANPQAGLRSPDNLTWSADGQVYVQEDRAIDAGPGTGQFGDQEASIWKLDPLTGQVSRWAQIDRSAVPSEYGMTDPAPTDVGNWESSGIIDVSRLYGASAGSYFMANVQAHSLLDGLVQSYGLVQGGQVSLIQATQTGLI
jgi:hypothetical protein